MPTASPLVFVHVTVGLAFVVPQVTATCLPCTVIPVTSPVVLAQVTVVVPFSVPLLSGTLFDA